MKPKLWKSNSNAKSKATIAVEAEVNLNISERTYQDLNKVHKLTPTTHSTSPNRQHNAVVLHKGKDFAKIIKLNLVDKNKKEGIYKDIYPSPNAHQVSLQTLKMYPRKISLKKLSLTNKLRSINQLFLSEELKLKHIDLQEDLEKNRKILSTKGEFESNSWFENVISLQERKSSNLTENLKFSNGIFRDMIIRLKGAGKENEGILIEKVWRYLLETFDEYIGLIHESLEKTEVISKNTALVQEDIEKIRTGCEVKVARLEKEIERVKLDYILAKDPRKIAENAKIQKVLPHIEKITEFIENLQGIYGKALGSPLKITSKTPIRIKENFESLDILKEKKRKKQISMPKIESEPKFQVNLIDASGYNMQEIN